MPVGHDEYWSGGERANVEAARAAGVHLAIFSGNHGFWKTRWENSIDGSNTPYRTLVCYKETHANAKIDPLPNVWTGTWRDPRFSPPADGGRPENALDGSIFTVNGIRNDAMLVPAADGKMRFWRNTSIASLAAGQTATLPTGVLGNRVGRGPRQRLPASGRRSHVDDDRVRRAVPAGLRHDVRVGNRDAPPDALQALVSGSLVFGAGTIQWPWGLDAQHDYAGPADRCEHAAGDDQPVRRHGRAAGHAAVGTRRSHGLDGHHCADGDHHLAGGRRHHRRTASR